MASANEAVAGLLTEYAELLQITGGDPFRARNYQKAARSVAGHPGDVAQLDVKELKAIPGVGASIAGKIGEVNQAGTFAALEELRGKIPAGVRQLTRIPGLGPKRALQLCQELDVHDVDTLAEAVKNGKLDGLRGFGPQSSARILHGIEVYRQGTDRVLLDVALQTATTIVDHLSKLPGCQRCTYAGSLRRWRETIGDVDILAAADESGPLMDAFKAFGDVIVSGPTKTSIRRETGLQVDLRVVKLDAWGAALQYFTGSQAHNVATRQIAVRKKLKLSEYGLFHAETDELIVSRTEEEVYERLGLQWVPPAMREDSGEVEAASRGGIPQLVMIKDLKGDLHTHTNLTDGVASLEDMVRRGERLGYEYYAVTDHAPNLIMQRMTDEKMLAQRERVRALEATMALTLLHGTELNIAPDGSVDWDEDFLSQFDICVASVHSHFDQSRKEMTRRFVAACENPYVHVIGHPTARRIGKRAGVDVDFGELFKAAARTGTALEINASPQRLDLPSDHIRAARDAGVKFAIDSDAHSVPNLGNMPYGVGTAQRGWLTPDDVINTWPLDRLLAFLRKKRLFPGAAAVYIDVTDGPVLVASAVAYALKAAAPLTSADMARVTPCPEWNVGELLRHLCDSVAALDEALGTGKLSMMAPVPSPRGPADGCPVELLRDRASGLLWTLFASDIRVVEVGGLPVPCGLALAAGAMEIAVHGWDIYVASGRGRPLPGEIARPLVRVLPSLVPDRRSLFASPVATPRCASPGDRVIAYAGRDPSARRGGYSRVA